MLVEFLLNATQLHEKTRSVTTEKLFDVPLCVWGREILTHYQVWVRVE